MLRAGIDERGQDPTQRIRRGALIGCRRLHCVSGGSQSVIDTSCTNSARPATCRYTVARPKPARAAISSILADGFSASTSADASSSRRRFS